MKKRLYKAAIKAGQISRIRYVAKRVGLPLSYFADYMAKYGRLPSVFGVCIDAQNLKQGSA